MLKDYFLSLHLVNGMHLSLSTKFLDKNIHRSEEAWVRLFSEYKNLLLWNYLSLPRIFEWKTPTKVTIIISRCRNTRLLSGSKRLRLTFDPLPVAVAIRRGLLNGVIDHTVGDFNSSISELYSLFYYPLSISIRGRQVCQSLLWHTVLFVTFNFAMQISVQKFLDIIIINKYYICRIVCNV